MRDNIISTQRLRRRRAPARNNIPRQSALCQMIERAILTRQNVGIDIARARRSSKGDRRRDRRHGRDDGHGVHMRDLMARPQHGVHRVLIDFKPGIPIGEENGADFASFGQLGQVEVILQAVLGPAVVGTRSSVER